MTTTEWRVINNRRDLPFTTKNMLLAYYEIEEGQLMRKYCTARTGASREVYFAHTDRILPDDIWITHWCAIEEPVNLEDKEG